MNKKKIYIVGALATVAVLIGLLLFTYTGRTIIRFAFDIPVKDALIGVTKEELKEQRERNLSRAEDS